MEKIQNYARLGDTSLSHKRGRVRPRRLGCCLPVGAAGLGPWLTDDRLSMWDGLCVAKLDRLTRSLIDFVTLMSWLEARGKTLVCLDPNSTSPPIRACVRADPRQLAEYERETIAARVRDAWHKLRTDGQYAGG